MSFDVYIKKKQKVINLLSSIKDKCKEDSTKQFIEQKLNNIIDDRYIISVFGHFSNGKSTFLNALMGFGDEVLVEDDLPSTATITRLKYPNDLELLNKAQITHVDGIVDVIPMEELKNYSARNRSFDVENKIKEITLFLDSEYLKNGVEIVDTPGFNSTYTVHTDIAKGYVEKSDASIFLFSYDKPGSEEEFKFLNYINKYMNRVFFVVNKIDLDDDPQNVESSIISTLEDIRSKLKIKNVNIEDKEIYPISAKLAKEAIKEKSKAKKEYSKFDYFKNELSNYLTSDENSKDRLFEPLLAVERKLLEERKLIEERIRICSKNQEDIKKELENQRKNIENAEKELKEKKKYIQNNVRSAISNAKNIIENNNFSIVEEVKDELQDISSQFHLRLVDFESMAIGVHDKFLKNWNSLTNKLEDKFIEIIEENIDNDKEVKETSDRLISIIHKSLDINKIDIETPKFDFKELDGINKEIENRKKDYENNREKLLRSKDDKQKYTLLIEEKEKLQRQIDKLLSDKERKLESIGEARPYKAEIMVQQEKKRGGLLGGLGNLLFGPKIVSKRESFVDYSEVEFIEKKRKEVQDNFSSEILVKEEEMKNKLHETMLFGDIDSKIFDMEFDTKQSRERYLKILETEEDEKLKMSSQIIKVSKDNFLKEIRRASEEYERIGKLFLDSNKNLMTTIILSALDEERRQVDELKNNIYTIANIEGTSPEELQIEVKNMYDNLQIILDNIKEVKRFREEEI